MNTLVIAELHEGSLRKSTHSGHHLRPQVGAPFAILLLGSDVKNAVTEAAAFGAEKVLVASDASLKDAVAERYAPTVAQVAKSGNFDVIVVTASSYGKDPRRAGRQLGAGYVPDISGVKNEGGKITFRRPVYAGNAYGNAEIQTPVKVVSVRQSEFSAAEPSGGNSPSENVAVALPMRRRRASNSSRWKPPRASDRIWAKRRSSSRAGAPSRALCRSARSAGQLARRCRRCKPRGVRRRLCARRSYKSAKPVAWWHRSSISPSAFGRDSALGRNEGLEEHRAINKDPEARSSNGRLRLGARPFHSRPRADHGTEKGLALSWRERVNRHDARSARKKESRAERTASWRPGALAVFLSLCPKRNRGTRVTHRRELPRPRRKYRPQSFEESWSDRSMSRARWPMPSRATAWPTRFSSRRPRRGENDQRAAPGKVPQLLGRGRHRHMDTMSLPLRFLAAARNLAGGASQGSLAVPSAPKQLRHFARAARWSFSPRRGRP